MHGTHYMRYISQRTVLITCGIYITMHGSHYMRYISQCTVLITCGIYHNARFKKRKKRLRVLGNRVTRKTFGPKREEETVVKCIM